MKPRRLIFLLSAICLSCVLLLTLLSGRNRQTLHGPMNAFKLRKSEPNFLQSPAAVSASNMREAVRARTVDPLTVPMKQSAHSNQSTIHESFVSKVLVSDAKPQRKSKTNYFANLRFGHENLPDGKPLLAGPTPFQPERKTASEVKEFLSRTHLVETPFDTDGLSPYLTTSHEVINEAKRIHLNVFRDIFNGKKYALLFQVIFNGNRGDCAIGVGEFTLLQQLGIEVVFSLDRAENNDNNYHRALAIARRYPAHEVVILLSGGGNFGFHVREAARERTLRLFAGYSVVVFPASMYYYTTEKDFHFFQKLYCCNPNVTMLLRDRVSLRVAQRLFTNGTRLILTPDMAFQLGYRPRRDPPFYDIRWIKRNDRELPVYSGLNPKSLFPPNVTVSLGDWGRARSEGYTLLEKITNRMEDGLGILQRGRVVVTDRLHGHILCVLLDIPHVLLDNAGNKLSIYHNTWTRAITNCRLAATPQDAVRHALELLEEYKDVLPTRLNASHHSAP